MSKKLKAAADRVAREKEVQASLYRLSTETRADEVLRQRVVQLEAQLLKNNVLLEQSKQVQLALHEKTLKLERQLRAALNLVAELGA